MSHCPVEDGDVAMEREAEVADASCLALFHEPVEQSVVEVSLVDGVHAASPDAVQQEIVYVVCLEIFKAAFKHRLAFLEFVLRGREVRHLCCDEVVAALVAACFEGNAQAFLALAATIGGRCVEVVDAVVERVLAEAVHLLLIDDVATVFVLCVGQAHPSITEQTDLVALLGIGAVCHLICGDRAVVVPHVIHFAVGVVVFYAARCQSCCGGCCARDFQEVSSCDIFLNLVSFYISLCTSCPST